MHFNCKFEEKERRKKKFDYIGSFKILKETLLMLPNVVSISLERKKGEGQTPFTLNFPNS